MYKLKIKPKETLQTKYGTAKISKMGYYQITTSKEGNNGKRLHRLIFEDFYGPIPEKCHIHHKDENKNNNCILNLQLLTEKQHNSLHKPSEESKQKISEAKNTTGYFRVYKHKDSTCKQGFRFCYRYYEDGKRKSIESVDIEKLEQKVKDKGLPWYKIGGVNL